MKIVNKIKAIINVAGEGLVLHLKAAEIKMGKAFLHPIDNDKVTYLVKAQDIDILFNNGEEITRENFEVLEKSSAYSDSTDKKQEKANHTQSSHTNNRRNPLYTKRKITFVLYKDECDTINQMIKESGYKRSDYFLASILNAQKKTNNKSFCAECERVKKARNKRESELEMSQKVG